MTTGYYLFTSLFVLFLEQKQFAIHDILQKRFQNQQSSTQGRESTNTTTKATLSGGSRCWTEAHHQHFCKNAISEGKVLVTTGYYLFTSLFVLFLKQNQSRVTAYLTEKIPDSTIKHPRESTHQVELTCTTRQIGNQNNPTSNRQSDNRRDFQEEDNKGVAIKRATAVVSTSVTKGPQSNKQQDLNPTSSSSRHQLRQEETEIKQSAGLSEITSQIHSVVAGKNQKNRAL